MPHDITVRQEWIGEENGDEDDPENWKIFSIPTIYEVCPTCHGEGRHTNPAIDGHGLTREDFDEQGPEFFEDYMSGVYDVNCAECGGKRVVLVPDKENADPELLKEYEQQEEEKYQDARMHQMEMQAEYGYGY